MAIATLAYKITADTRGLQKGVQASRKEINLAKRVMQETKSPASKLEDALSGLEGIHKKGLITSQQYADAQAKVRKELGLTSTAAVKTKTQVKSLGGAFGSIRGVLTNFAGPLGVATGGFAGIAAAIGSIKQSLKEIDALSKESQKLGIDINVLRGFQHAADLAGISADTLGTSLQRMTRKIGDASRGQAESVKVFDSLGLNVKDLVGLTPDQQFIEVADSISKMQTQTEKLSATVKIFDSEGADLVRLLDLGADGFANARKEVEALRGAIDPKEIENFNDELAKADLVREGFFGGTAQNLAGQFGQVTGGATDLLKALGLSGGDLANISNAAAENFRPFVDSQAAIRRITEETLSRVVSGGGDRKSERSTQEQTALLKRIAASTQSTSEHARRTSINTEEPDVGL